MRTGRYRWSQQGALEALVAFDGLDDGVGADADVGCGGDLIDEVVGHGGAKTFAADDDLDFGGVAGEVDGALSGGIAASDDHDAAVAAGEGFGSGGAVVDSGTGAFGDAGGGVFAIGHASGDDQGVGDDFAAGGQLEAFVAAVKGYGGDFDGGEEFGAEALGLEDGAAGEFGAADAGGEAEVVLDAGAGAGLATGSVAIQEQRPQSFRSAVDRRRETCRTRADDDEIVEIMGSGDAEAEVFGELGQGGMGEGSAVFEQHGREIGVRESSGGEEVGRLGVAIDIEPAVGDEITGEEILDGVGEGGPLAAEEAEAGGFRGAVGVPGIEEVVDDGEEVFFGGVPGFGEVVIGVGLRRAIP